MCKMQQAVLYLNFVQTAFFLFPSSSFLMPIVSPSSEVVTGSRIRRGKASSFVVVVARRVAHPRHRRPILMYSECASRPPPRPPPPPHTRLSLRHTNAGTRPASFSSSCVIRRVGGLLPPSVHCVTLSRKTIFLFSSPASLLIEILTISSLKS